MQEKYLFEYAVIRVVPRVEREEFLNVGIIVYCQQQKFLQSMFLIDIHRLTAFSDTLDIHELEAYLLAFDRICRGGKAGGPIGELDVATRFRWLTAARSTVVQTSKVHPGLSVNPVDALVRLYTQLVL